MELFHHGIKGQRWGVRRYQNKDGSRTALGKERRNPRNWGVNVKDDLNGNDYTLKKGTKFFRTEEAAEGISKHRKYMTISDSDAGTYAAEMRGGMNVQMEREYRSIKDIHIAGTKNTINLILEAYGENKISDIEFDSAVEAAKKTLNWAGNDQAYRDYVTSKYSTDPSKWLDLMDDTPINSKIFETASKRGYDAISDVYDQGLFVNTPIVMLNPKKSIELAAETDENYNRTVYRKSKKK